MAPIPAPSDLMLHLVRTDALEHATLGQLFISGEYKWFTLEDRWHPTDQKVQGETCIPAGTYQVIINKSVRFGRMLPLLLNVPGFTGIRIHPGNTDADTAGCVLVGGSCVVPKAAGGTPFLAHSGVACSDVQQRIAQAISAGRRVWIEIIDPETHTGVDTPKEGEAAPVGAPVKTTLPGKVTLH